MARYLVVQLARFGDLVQTKRLLRTLCARGEVHLCLDRGLCDLARLLYPEAALHPLPVHAAPGAAAWDETKCALRKLADISFDAVYNCNYAEINRALVRMFDPAIVRGHAMRGVRPRRDAWVRMAFRWTRQRPLSPMNLVDFWAFFDREPCAPHEVNPPARGGGRGLGVVLAGRESRRSLPPEVLGQCVSTAFEALGGPPVFFLGGAAEQPLGRKLLRRLPGGMLDKVRDLSGKTSWAGLIEALVGLDAVLTPDTGVMHLAAHLGVPTRAFFLSSAWCHETGPYGEGHAVWQSTYECAPCLESASCPIGTACLKPFADKGLLRSLAAGLQGKPPTALPEDIAHYVSLVDGMGGTWRLAAGRDVHAERRRALRRLTAEYLGIAGMRPLPADAALTDMLYDEAGWMLPGVFPFSPLTEDAHDG